MHTKNRCTLDTLKCIKSTKPNPNPKQHIHTKNRVKKPRKTTQTPFSPPTHIQASQSESQHHKHKPITQHGNTTLSNLSLQIESTMGVSNKITATLNLMALLCSIFIMASGIWLASNTDNECIHAFRWPVFILGVLMLLVSLAGFVGAYFNKQGLLALYLFCMAALIILLLAVLIFAFTVTRPDGSYAVPGRAYREYQLDGFSKWLRDYVTDSETWGKIRACLADSDTCPKLNQNYITADQFFMAHISPLQSGCCKPPTLCGYNYVNPTLWINPVNQAADPDCLLWNNDQNLLCYNCNSCRAGLLGNLRKEWRRANVILIVAVVVLIWVYLIACSAFKNAQTEELFRKYKQGWV